MCGVMGAWSFRGEPPGTLQGRVARMLATLQHRGPDDCGMWLDTEFGIGLGHTRLSIIDLSSRARQPMVGPAGRTRLTYNGEIYNYQEPRRELERAGVVFKSESDSEVVAALYERDGLGCLGRLRGMFAFALWDSATRRLLLARDRLGKKPLYYHYQAGRRIVFGS